MRTKVPLFLVSADPWRRTQLSQKFARRGLTLVSCPLTAKALSALVRERSPRTAILDLETLADLKKILCWRDRLRRLGSRFIYLLPRDGGALAVRLRIRPPDTSLMKPFVMEELFLAAERPCLRPSRRKTQARSSPARPPRRTAAGKKAPRRADRPPAPGKASRAVPGKTEGGPPDAVPEAPLRDKADQEKTGRLRAFQELMSRSPFPLALVEAAGGRISHVNDRFARTVGRRAEDLIGKTTAESRLWVDSAPLAEALARLTEAPDSIVEREVAWRTDAEEAGRGLLAAWCVSSRPDEYFALCLYDSGDREACTREALAAEYEEERAMNRALLEALPELVFYLLAREHAPLTAGAVSGEPASQPSAFLGRHVRDLLPPALAEKFLDSLRRTVESGGREAFEYETTGRGRSNRIYEARLMAGGPDQVVTVVRDITDRRHAEVKLTGKTKLLATIFETAPSIMIVVDRDGRVDDVNRAGAAFTGKKKSQLVGSYIGNVLSCALSFVDPGCQGNAGCHLCRIRRDLAAVFDAGDPVYDTENRMTIIREQKSVEVDFLTSMALVAIEGVERVVVTVLDITERKKAMEIIRRQYLVSDALSLLYKPLITPNAMPGDIAPVILEQARRVTESPHGAVSLIDLGLQTETVVAYTSKRQLPGPMLPGGKDAHTRAVDEGALFRRRTRFFKANPQGYFTNTPLASYPRVDGAEVRIRFQRCLEVPVFLGYELVGVVSLSDAGRPYSEDDRVAVSRIAEFYAFAIQKYRAENRINALLVDFIGKNQELRETQYLLAASSALLKNNIDQAKEYQKKLIEFPVLASREIQVALGYFPSEPVGGDLIGAHKVGRSVIIYSADISGHGVPAAIISTYVKACLDDWILSHHCLSPARLLGRLGRLLKEKAIFHEDFITLFIAHLNLDTRRLVYANAGAPYPIYGNGRALSFARSAPPNAPISGLLPLPKVREHALTLNRRTQFLIYSDGLIEWITERDEVCGSRGLIAELSKSGLSGAAVARFIEKALRSKPEDDLSYVLIDFSTIYGKKYRLHVEDAAVAENDFNSFITGRFPEDVIIRSRHCFSELFMNAVEHGNRNRPGKTVKVMVKCLAQGGGLYFRIEDSGPGFPFRRLLRVHRRIANEYRGRGLMIVKRFADDFHFNLNGNAVHCTFKSGRRRSSVP